MKRFLRASFHVLSGVLLLSGCLHLLRVRSARGMALRSIKSLSEALSPFIAGASGISLVLGALFRAPLAVLAAALGGLLSLRYLLRIMNQPAGFAECFGEDWREQLNAVISPAQRSAMLPHPWQWRIPVAREEAHWERDLVYHIVQAEQEQTGFPLHYDLWRPPPGIPPTGVALIYIHGGGYFTSGKDFGTRPFFRHLSGQGHLIMDIDYQLAPSADLFDMLADVQHAVAWMKSNAEWLGGDPNRIVLAGGSAGAHLALLVAYAGNRPGLTPIELQETDLSISGVVSYYGIVDLAATYQRIAQLFENAPSAAEMPDNLLERPLARQVISLAAWVRGVEPAAMRKYLRDNQDLMFAGLHDSLNRLLGGSPDEIPEVYRLVSPLTYAGQGCPPTLFFQGEHDYLLPLEPARGLHHTLREAGVCSIYVEFPETEHTFDLFLPEYSPPAQTALYHTERFLGFLGQVLPR